MEVFLHELAEKALKFSGRLKETERMLEAPEVMAHTEYYIKLSREADELRPIAKSGETLKEYLALKEEIERLSPEELNISRDEIADLDEKIKAEAKTLISLLNRAGGGKNAVLSVKASSAEFALILYEMYLNFAKKQNFSVDADAELVKKNFSIIIRGENAWDKLKFESGEHVALSRIKSKETALVTAVAETAPVDIKIDEKDIRIDIFHSSGAGGQNVNKVETAVRITHLETGIAVVCQDERSQLKNKERAMKILTEKVNKHYEQKARDEEKKQKKQAEKSDYVRTYDFSLMKVKDNKTNLLLPLESVLEGEISAFSDILSLSQ